MHQPSTDDVTYTWEIKNFDHVTDTCLVSPEIQLPELGYGFWQVVLYPNDLEFRPMQCGLRNTPVVKGLHDTTVMFSFELLDDTNSIQARMSPRIGDFPDDNDVPHAFTFDIRPFEYSTLIVRCRIKRLGKDPFRSMTLSAVTEIVNQRVTEVVEIEDSGTVSFNWEIRLAKCLDPEDSTPSSKLPIVNVFIYYCPRRQSYSIDITSMIDDDMSLIASCLVSLLDTVGQVFPCFERQWHYFPDDELWEIYDFANRIDLDDKMRNLKDAQNRFRVHLDMQFHVGREVYDQDEHPVTRRHLPGCEVTLGDELVRAYESEEYCDWSISVGPHQPPIKVHKCLLASRSPFFKSMLGIDMMEQARDHILLQGIDYQALESMIRFMYSNKPVFVDDSGNEVDYRAAAEVYRAAHMYLLPELQGACSTFLKCQVNKDTAVFLRDFAILYEDVELEKAADEFLPVDFVVKEEDKEEISPKRPRLPRRSTRRIR